jgi:hypothetical protein
VGKALPCASFILAKNNYAGLYPTADQGIRTVLPHELFHAVQNAYDSNVARFWAEGTAQWAAKQLDPALTDLEKFLPGFFSETSRSLDSPPSGVTADFLYGAAIWPVFLTARHKSDVVRLILENEGAAGALTLDATDAVMMTDSSSLADEYVMFSVYNAATGTRAGAGGYANAASYPLVKTIELPEGTAVSGTTSGLATFFYHVTTTSPQAVTLTADEARTRAMVLPLVDGKAAVDKAAPLPATLDGEGIIVVSGITTKKTDANFTITLTTAPNAGADGGADAAPSGGGGKSGGCALSSGARDGSGAPPLPIVALLAFLFLVRSTSRGSVEGRTPRLMSQALLARGARRGASRSRRTRSRA